MIPLVCSSYTLGTEVGLADRVHAAAAAGFDGIGLRAENYWDAQQAGLDDADILAMVDHHATRVLEVEYLTGWGTADRDDAQQARERTVFHLARTFGVRHVNAGLLERLPFERTVHAFAALCDRAGDDLTVALEFMPYSGIPTLTAAWRVIAEAGKANAALIVDVWHWRGPGRRGRTSRASPRIGSCRCSCATCWSTRWIRLARSHSVTASRRGGGTGTPRAWSGRCRTTGSGRASSPRR